MEVNQMERMEKLAERPHVWPGHDVLLALSVRRQV